jgi:hypothetical protein
MISAVLGFVRWFRQHRSGCGPRRRGGNRTDKGRSGKAMMDSRDFLRLSGSSGIALRSRQREPQASW